MEKDVVKEGANDSWRGVFPNSSGPKRLWKGTDAVGGRRKITEQSLRGERGGAPC